MNELPIIVLIWIVCGIASLGIAQARHDPMGTNWFVIGVLLGPIGVIWALVSASPNEPEG